MDQIVLSDWLVHMWNKSHSLIDVKSYYDELTFVIMLRVLCLPARKKMQVGTASSWTSSLWMTLPVCVGGFYLWFVWLSLWYVEGCGCICDLCKYQWHVDVSVIY